MNHTGNPGYYQYTATDWYGRPLSNGNVDMKLGQGSPHYPMGDVIGTSRSLPGAPPYSSHVRNRSADTQRGSSPDDKRVPSPEKAILTRWSDHTSLQGIPFIYRSRCWYSRVIWSVLFLAAVGATTFQLYEVLTKYFKYETTSQVSVGYSPLPLPSITICNINPVRVSQIDLASEDLQQFLVDLSPDTEYDSDTIDTTRPPHREDNLGLTNEVKRRKKRQAPKAQTQTFGSKVDEDYINKLSSEIEHQKFEDELDIDEDDDYYAPRAVHTIMDTHFSQLLTSESDDTRREMGHQKETFILGCSFRGKQCSAANFSESLNPKYGNCFTFNSPELKSKPMMARRSGSSLGLQLMLYLEKHEYVQSYTHGMGIRLDIHPFNTLPFVEESGMSIPPGVEAYIGMQMVNMTRLGGKYGTCGDRGVFRKAYNKNYTIEGCTGTCLDRTIAAKCGCYRQAYKDIYPEGEKSRLEPCETDTELLCVYTLMAQDMAGNLSCGCNGACNAVSYESQVSSHIWPEENLWHSLVDSVCEVDDYACWYLQDNDEDHELRMENFLRLNIYYRDLNFQSIKQQPAYELSQFLSDLGGTAGLYLGASALTGIEVLDLIFQYIRHACCGKRKDPHSWNPRGAVDRRDIRDPME